MPDPFTTAAIGWGFSAAGWLISPVFTRFLNKCFDALGIDVPPKFQSRKKTLSDKLERLETTLLPKLLILTDAAEKSPHKSSLELWLQKLKFAYYDAEHVLGLVEYERLEEKLDSLFPSGSKEKVDSLFPSGKPSFKNFKGKVGSLFPSSSSSKKKKSRRKDLIKSLEILEKTVDEGMEFVSLLQLSSDSANKSNWSPSEPYRETISTPGSTVIGRDKDRDEIIKLLREDIPESSSNAKCYSVIGIWGMGGLGKTTLAQYVSEYEKKDEYFDHVIWAHVSQNFSVYAILNMIWESAFKEHCPNFSSLEGLQSKLEEKISRKRFFLVLDDVWCDKGVSEQKIEQLFAPLRAGKRGSKILVTTRIEAAAQALHAVHLIPLPELDYKQFLFLFMSNAFGEAPIRDNHVKKRLTEIGEKIAAKLNRSPLAAKAVAAQLRRKLDPNFWSSMLNKRFLNGTMGVLFLSYQHLPPHLQRCFAFCSLFPKGFRFKHDQLVNLWIAEGFIEVEDTNESSKDIADGYILELISTSFFQVTDKLIRRNQLIFSNRYSLGGLQRYQAEYSMHDLLHDLAEHVSEGECFRIESGAKRDIPTQTRRIFAHYGMIGNYVEEICKLEELRTIILSTSSGVPYKDKLEVVLDAVFMKSKKLRVVDLENYFLYRIPDSVVELENLRYFCFEGNAGAAFPKSLNKLYHLCILCTMSQIPDVGRLILLQHLTQFDVRKNKGFELEQLEHLNGLSGSLSIYGLHNVERKEDAYLAKLSNKIGLRSLSLSWSFESKNAVSDLDVQILDELCPPPQIKELAIKGYGGQSFPSWILEDSKNITYLEHLKLADCQYLEALGRINELSDLLSLTISFLPKLKRWELPLNLTQLEISGCPSLAFVLKEDLELIEATKDVQITQIVTFLEHCSKISWYGSIDFQFVRTYEMMKLGDHIDETILPAIGTDLKKCLKKRLDLICQLKALNGISLSFPISLEELYIKSCFITNKILASSLQALPSLVYLILMDILTITCIPEEVLDSLINLVAVDVRGCLLLTSVGGLETHNILEELKVECCPSLTFEPSLVANNNDMAELTPSSCRRKTRSSVPKNVTLDACMPSDNILENLVFLRLDACDCPTIVSPYIGHSKSLTFLRMEHCVNLVSLSGLSELNNLRYLNVIGCHKLRCYPNADKLPQLEELLISKLSLIGGLISRDGLCSLVQLEIVDAREEYFPEEECDVLCSLSSLQALHIKSCNMQSLPNLLCLRSLKTVTISYCKNIISMPELPSSVQSLCISDCNTEFTRRCKDPSDQFWQMISRIPNKDIY